MKPRAPETLILLVAGFIAIALNQPFWRKFDTYVSPNNVEEWLFFATALVTAVVSVYLVLLAVSLKPVFRVAIAVLLPVTASVSYFVSEYGVVIDADVVRSVFETNTSEAGDLITVGMVCYVGLLGVLPAIFVCLIPWKKRSFADEALAKLRFAVPAALLLAIAFAPFWSDYFQLFRDHRDLKLTFAPLNYVSALVTYWQERSPSGQKVVARFGADAKRAANGTRKSLFVIVVGETARWDHFAINGYSRPTNPGLSKVNGLVDYPKAYSCGTNTVHSLPCMFSGLGKANFSIAKADDQENLLDILKRAGVDVLWRENQWGCKGVCARVPTETLTGLKARTFYPSTKNYDDILVDGLDEKIAKLAGDTVIVLHMMGSHWIYWTRYPEKFETFRPVCKQSDFKSCKSQEVTNAYDNTLVYTDHVLTRLIGVLSGAADKGVNAGMLYVSDHGESLGENLIYLHGMPYAIAPEAQIHVPMVVWLAPSMRDALSIDQTCLTKNATKKVSHDNLFHSVLGVMNVTTRVYDPSLDLFAACRRALVSRRDEIESVIK